MSYRTVLLKSTNDNFIELEVDESKTVTPGMVVERVAGGKCQPHTTPDGEAQKLIAVENYLEGEDVDTEYSAGDRCIVKVAAPGERFAVLHQTDASSSNGMVKEGDKLNSDGNGYLRPNATDNIVAVALESNDTTASSSSVNPRFAAEII